MSNTRTGRGGRWGRVAGVVGAVAACAGVACAGTADAEATADAGTDSVADWVVGVADDAPAEGFVFHEMSMGGTTYRYVVYRPRGLDASVPARGLVFLHGRGECGVDGSKHLGVGLGPALVWDADRWPFVVLMPQKPTGESEWEDHDAAVMAMLDRMIAEHNVDAKRVAITGLSQGGHGTIQIAARHPGRFAAAAPVCGYIMPVWRNGERVNPFAPPTAEETAGLAAAFAGVPVKIFHGGRDDVVPASQSERFHEILRAGGVESELVIFPEDNHNSWDSTYRKSGVWVWFVEKTGG